MKFEMDQRSPVSTERVNNEPVPRLRAYLTRRIFQLWQAVTILTVLIGAIGLALAILHGIEAGLWAGCS